MSRTYGPCAEFIKLAHKAGFHPTFVNISFVGANALAKELEAAGEGVVVPRWCCFRGTPRSRSSPTTKAAQKALDPSLPPGFVSLEGYLAGPHPTRACLLRAIKEAGQFDISGSIITVGPKMQNAPPKVFLTVIQKDGPFRAVDRL